MSRAASGDGGPDGITGRESSAAWPLLLVVLCGCTGVGENAIALTPVEEWTTEPEYEFGDVFEGDALFAGIADVDVSPDGSRIYVVDYAASEVTIWTPDGSLVRRFGQEGEGPGDFLAPGDLTLRDDALTVRDRRGFTTFSLDGEFVARDMVPPGINCCGGRPEVLPRSAVDPPRHLPGRRCDRERDLRANADDASWSRGVR